MAEWAKKPPCTMCASTAHGWGDCKLKAKCTFLACQCARDKMCWVDADEMPTGKDLVNALGKPIVAKLLIEKLKKCRTEKGKTVSSIETCNECENEPPNAPHALMSFLQSKKRIPPPPGYHTRPSIIHLSIAVGRGTQPVNRLKAGLASLTLSWSTQQVH